MRHPHPVSGTHLDGRSHTGVVVSGIRPHSPFPSIDVQMPRGGKGKMKTKQSSLQTAGLLPMLKKPAEAIGTYLYVPGAFWDKCPAADKEKIFQCLVRDFDALHKFIHGICPMP